MIEAFLAWTKIQGVAFKGMGIRPVGKSVDALLRRDGLRTVVVDLNMVTIESLTGESRAAIYGDAFNIEVMHQVLPAAAHLIITLPHSTNCSLLIVTAKLFNPTAKVSRRARYISEREQLKEYTMQRGSGERLCASGTSWRPFTKLKSHR